jgi:hypothetical protein
MSGVDNLSGRQFNTDRILTAQGNSDEDVVKHRGYQTLTSNVYKPAFANLNSNVEANPSPARAQEEE